MEDRSPSAHIDLSMLKIWPEMLHRHALLCGLGLKKSAEAVDEITRQHLVSFSHELKRVR